MVDLYNKLLIYSVLFLASTIVFTPLDTLAATCKTQSQMTASQRDALSTAARSLVGHVQSGNVQALRSNTIPSVAANFSGIASSINALEPLVQPATITVDSLYLLNATVETSGISDSDFYCGSPVVVLHFTDLPPGTYALVILHASGVPHPQQISLILSEVADHQWMLAGFFSRPMTETGHDGLWYWVTAREYTRKNKDWDAWFYYRTAAYLLDPVDFLTSPNLEKLKYEQDKIHPNGLPGAGPISLDINGSAFRTTAVDITTAFGALDLDVRYEPDPAQTGELHDPSTARIQVVQVMRALLLLHPELNEAFHGIWVHADSGANSIYSLELPMDQIASATQQPTMH